MSNIQLICKCCHSPTTNPDNTQNKCVNCEAKTTFLKIPETDIEICMFGMIADGEGCRLVEHNETPDSYDVLVKTTQFQSGEIIALYEFDDLTREEADQTFLRMETLFPNAGIESLIGTAA